MRSLIFESVLKVLHMFQKVVNWTFSFFFPLFFWFKELHLFMRRTPRDFFVFRTFIWSFIIVKKNVMALFMDAVQLYQGYSATKRRLFTFYHKAPRRSWYSFLRPHKDERLNWRSSHPAGDLWIGNPVPALYWKNDCIFKEKLM